MTLKKLVYGLIKKCKFLPPNVYMKYYYEYYTGKPLNLENPIEFNEKISWLKVYYHPPILTQLVDKYAVRNYVKEKIGEKYLNDLIQVYTKVSDINFETLPNKYVIKGVHGCGFNLIVEDSKKLNKTKAKALLRKWALKKQYYRGGLEWAYKNVPPHFIAEKFLNELNNSSIIDYKFFCFNGKAQFLEVHIDRNENHRSSFYDLNFNKLPFRDVPENKTITKPIEKPIVFDEMIAVAEKLADKLPFVRVDLYALKEKIIFGEMTFYPADGRSEFYPEKYNTIIGDYLKLPHLKKGQKEITTI